MHCGFCVDFYCQPIEQRRCQLQKTPLNIFISMYIRIVKFVVLEEAFCCQRHFFCILQCIHKERSLFFRRNGFFPYQTGSFVFLHFAICILRKVREKQKGRMERGNNKPRTGPLFSKKRGGTGTIANLNHPFEKGGPVWT